jgi:hypothetical protein
MAVHVAAVAAQVAAVEAHPAALAAPVAMTGHFSRRRLAVSRAGFLCQLLHIQNVLASTTFGSGSAMFGYAAIGMDLAAAGTATAEGASR